MMELCYIFLKSVLANDKVKVEGTLNFAVGFACHYNCRKLILYSNCFIPKPVVNWPFP